MVTSVILAAGIGSRLSPITDEIPKCMVEVRGVPLIDYQIKSLVLAGVNKIVIVVGYRGEQIRSHCQKYDDIDFVYIENEQFMTSNNMYSFYLARNEIRNCKIILNNADLYIPSHLVSSMIEDPRENLIAVDNGEFIDDAMKIRLSEKGFINSLSKKISAQDSEGISLDFYKFNAKFVNRLIEISESYVEKLDLNSWTEVAIQEVIDESNLLIAPLYVKDTIWREIDTVSDLVAVNEAITIDQLANSLIEEIFLDIDGTLLTSQIQVDVIDQFLTQLRASNVNLRFISNNSSRSVSDAILYYQSKGLHINKDELHLSQLSLIEYLKSKDFSEVYLVGTDSLVQEFRDHGIEQNLLNPSAVCISYDTEINYEKIRIASEHINSGIPYFVTHSDVAYPSEVGPIPDAGAFMRMFVSALNIEPTRVFGKPEFIQGLTASGYGIVIGDRISTDLEFAKNMGMRGVLVLTGATNFLEVYREKQDILVLSSVLAVKEILNRGLKSTYSQIPN